MTLPDRRKALGTALAATAAAGVAPGAVTAPGSPEAYRPKGGVKHSMVWWCFHSVGDKWDVPTACGHAKALGIASIELIEPDHWATLKKLGLTCAIAGNGYAKTGFMYGLNNPRHAGDVVAATAKRIGVCAAAGVPSVIGFSGYRWADPADPKSGEISRDDGARQMVKSLKELAAVAEKAGVTVCVEHLNTRDASHPMKGHPGYMADDLDWLAGVIRAVGSPRVKILFDLYHVQVMHGDLIRRIDEYKDVIGHVHTAGVPGRGELDDAQEIHFAGCVKKLLAVEYAGYVGHEFIPTRDAYAGLAQAVRVCDA